MKMMLRFMNATTKLFESEIAKSVEVSKKTTQHESLKMEWPILTQHSTSKTDSEIELHGLCGKFSMETIASCAFGLNASSFTGESSLFVKHAKSIFDYTFMDNIR